jgi:hypothetical protein
VKGGPAWRRAGGPVAMRSNLFSPCDVYRRFGTNTEERIVRSHSVRSGGCAVVAASFRRCPLCVLNSKGGLSLGCTHSNITNPIVGSNPNGEIA